MTSSTDRGRPPLVRRAAPDEFAVLSTVLTRAFDGYAWTRWTVPADAHVVRLTSLYDAYLRHADASGGRIWVTEDLAAVAVFVPADMPPPSVEISAQIAAAHGDRLSRVEAHLAAAAATLPAHDWSVAAVGVLPEHRGRGWGGAVLRAGLAELAGCRLLLETSEPANVELYEHCGFRVVGLFTANPRPDPAEDGTDPRPPVWVMVAG